MAKLPPLPRHIEIERHKRRAADEERRNRITEAGTEAHRQAVAERAEREQRRLERETETERIHASWASI